MIVLAHLSDIHIDGTERNTERAQRVMDYLNGLRQPVDAILATGDLADHGLPAEYEVVRKVLASPQQVFTCPGNHDVRGPFREVLLGEHPSAGPVNQVFRAAGAVFAMCDSSIPGKNEGFLDDRTLAWLEGVLAGTAPGDPVFVCFHHPPVRLHSPLLDGIRQSGEERLAALAERHPQIVAFLCGHAHTAAASTFAGLPLLVAPGVVSTLRLPWETGEVSGFAEVTDYDLPPAVAFHVLDDERRVTTHYRVVPVA